MSFLIAAVGAVVAALIETSVFPELRIDLNLVFAFTLVSAMLLGIEEGLTWAVVGGLSLDLMTPGARALGSTMLVLLLVSGAGLFVARVAQPPRIVTVIVTVFALTFAYQALGVMLLAATEGVRLDGVSPSDWALPAVLNTIVAAIVARLIRSASLRFGRAEQALR
jgi:hypothetical protein